MLQDFFCNEGLVTFFSLQHRYCSRSFCDKSIVAEVRKFSEFFRNNGLVAETLVTKIVLLIFFSNKDHVAETNTFG